MDFVIPSMSNLRLAKFIYKAIKFSFLTAFFFFQLCLGLFKGRTEAVKKTWISFVTSSSPIIKYSVKGNIENKTLVPFYCSLFSPNSAQETTGTNIMHIFSCLKLLKPYNKKGQIIRLFLLFLVPYIRFLFESLELIRVFCKIRSDKTQKVLRCPKNS